MPPPRANQKKEKTAEIPTDHEQHTEQSQSPAFADLIEGAASSLFSRLHSSAPSSSSVSSVAAIRQQLNVDKEIFVKKGPVTVLNPLVESSLTEPAKAVDLYKNIQLPASGGVIRSVDGSREKAAAKAARPDTAGSGWFNLPAPVLTADLKQDLRLMNLRGYLDPKHFMKRISKERKKNPFPKYFQIGTVLNGPADHFSGRLTHAERAESFAETILRDKQQAGYLKRKFTEAQQTKTSIDKQRKQNKKPKVMAGYSKKK